MWGCVQMTQFFSIRCQTVQGSVVWGSGSPLQKSYMLVALLGHQTDWNQCFQVHPEQPQVRRYSEIYTLLPVNLLRVEWALSVSPPPPLQHCPTSSDRHMGGSLEGPVLCCTGDTIKAQETTHGCQSGVETDCWQICLRRTHTQQNTGSKTERLRWNKLRRRPRKVSDAPHEKESLLSQKQVKVVVHWGCVRPRGNVSV